MRPLLVTLLATLAWLPAHSPAQTVSRYGAYPADPSTADHVIIAIPDGCGDIIAKPAEVSTSPNDPVVHQLNVFFKTPDEPVVCPGLWPPGGYHAFDLGQLGEGEHKIRVYRIVDDGEIPSLEDQPSHEFGVSVSGIAGTSVSGAWFAPEQSGRGIFLIRVPLTSGQQAGENLFIVYWANHDADGNPTWALTSGQMTNHVVSGTAVYTTGTPLAPGTAELAQQEWGQLSFEYLGCDKGRLTWNALDQTITDGSVDIIKLANPDGQEVCSIPSAIEAVWTD